MSSQVQAAHDILKRLPPSSDSLAHFSSFLTPAQLSALHSKSSLSLHTLHDPDSDRDFLCCAFNQQGESYRSPYSGQYYPPNEEGYEPSVSLRRLEVQANEHLEDYTRRYYGDAISSAYFSHSIDKIGFSACFLIQKTSSKREKSGSITSIHFIEMVHEGSEKKLYQVTSHLQFSLSHSQTTQITGNFYTSKEEKLPLTDNISTEAASLELLRLIEDSENSQIKQLTNFLSSRISGTVKCMHWQRSASDQVAFRARHDVLMAQLMASGMGIRGSDSAS